LLNSNAVSFFYHKGAQRIFTKAHKGCFFARAFDAAGIEAAAGGSRGHGFCRREEADAGRPRNAFAKPAPGDTAIADSPTSCPK